ncbi:hypothetical protein [Desemzia sp. FAM 23989]|uniref:hypothetical protein n=1 Tax=Desemzia sp. FAM 23989 TaxID=3259523 RepID=UPI00388A8598
MKKKIKVSLLTIITFLNLLLFGLTIWINYGNESYIATINQHLAEASAENQDKGREIELLKEENAEKSEQLQVSNWKLGQIEARDEGIKYQESDK